MSSELESADGQSVYRFDDQFDQASNDGRDNKFDHRVSYYVNNDALRQYNVDQDDEDDADSMVRGLGGGARAANRNRDYDDY